MLDSVAFRAGDPLMRAAAAASWLVLAVFHAFHASVKPLPQPVRAEIQGRAWHAGCPVPLSGLRVLTVTYWGFDSRPHDGQMVVNADAAHPLAKVFRRLCVVPAQHDRPDRDPVGMQRLQAAEAPPIAADHNPS